MIKFEKKRVARGLAIAMAVFFHCQWIASAIAAQELSRNAPPDVEIVIHMNNDVVAERFCLKDIADISADPYLKQSIEELDLGGSPGPGEIVSIQKRKIVSQIKKMRFLPDDTQVRCPETIYIKRLGQRLEQEDILEFIRQHLSKELLDKRFTIGDIKIRGLGIYPLGKATGRINGEKIIKQYGKFSTQMNLMIDGRLVDKIHVSGKVRAYEKAIFSTADFPKGHQFSGNDIYLKEIDVFAYSGRPICNNNDKVIGQIAKQSIKRDTPLGVHQVTAPPMVKKGELISIVARNQNLLIVTSGISKEDGFENDLIRVENIHSGKLVRGIVKEKSSVEVMY